jgi:hypothetical protein
LKLLLGWPASLGTWDILFLLPVPWAAPVLAPSLVAAVMAGTGIWHLRREARGEPVHIEAWQWAAIMGGAAILILSFTMDYRNLMAGGVPRPFHWGVFLLGLGVGVAGYGAAASATGKRTASPGPAALVAVPEEGQVRGATL